MEKKHNCPECKFRTKYDQNPKSFLGKLWRWHINWCPGWRAYMTSLNNDQKAEITLKYNMNKK